MAFGDLGFLALEFFAGRASLIAEIRLVGLLTAFALACAGIAVGFVALALAGATASLHADEKRKKPCASDHHL